MADVGKQRERRNPIGAPTRIVGANVKRIRGDIGFTQADLSRSLAQNGHPIPVSSIGRIETGDRRVEVDDLVALALALGVSPLALLLPHTRGPEDVVEFSGWGPDLARDVWGFSLGIAEIADVSDEEPGVMARSFPLWVEERLRRWAAPSPDPDDLFHPRGD